MTEAGQIYFRRCKRIVDEAFIQRARAQGICWRNQRRAARVAAGRFAQTYLAPLIAEFAQRYPAIAFELDLTPRRVDLVSEPIDLAIRMGELLDSRLIARQIALLTPALYASPELPGPAGRAGHATLTWRSTNILACNAPPPEPCNPARETLPVAISSRWH